MASPLAPRPANAAVGRGAGLQRQQRLDDRAHAAAGRALDRRSRRPDGTAAATCGASAAESARVSRHASRPAAPREDAPSAGRR